jgi:hypothetical protein
MARQKSTRAISRPPPTRLTGAAIWLIMLFSIFSLAARERRGKRRELTMWDSRLYVEHATRERTRELASAGASPSARRVAAMSGQGWTYAGGEGR